MATVIWFIMNIVSALAVLTGAGGLALVAIRRKSAHFAVRVYCGVSAAALVAVAVLTVVLQVGPYFALGASFLILLLNLMVGAGEYYQYHVLTKAVEAQGAAHREARRPKLNFPDPEP